MGYMDLHRHTNTNATSGQDPVTPYKHNDPWRCHGTLLRHPSFEFIVFNPSFELIMFNPHFLNSQFFQLSPILSGEEVVVTADSRSEAG
jgi:hypothetical protein